MAVIAVRALGQALEMETAPELFSPQRADRGTLAMLSHADLAPGLRVLDLGCGWGLVGVLAARICGEGNAVLCDIDPRAVALARRNAERNGVGNVKAVVSDAFDGINDTGFDLILTNPPYQSDFAVAKRFIEKGFNRLKVGGRLLMVTKRRTWYRNKLVAIFGGVRVCETDGYFVFEAEKRGQNYANRASHS